MYIQSFFLTLMLEFIHQRLASFQWAIQGILDLYKHHPNAQVHLLATCLVIPTGFLVQLSAIEWCIIIICIVLVTAMEAMNSAVEYLADKVSPKHDELIGKAKDIAAGAVFLCSIGAASVGCILLLPKIVQLVRSLL